MIKPSKEYYDEIKKLVADGLIENDILKGAGTEKSSSLWSDRFFNFDDIPSLDWENDTDEVMYEKCLYAGNLFKNQWPKCPFSANWLAENYLHRL